MYYRCAIGEIFKVVGAVFIEGSRDVESEAQFWKY